MIAECRELRLLSGLGVDECSARGFYRGKNTDWEGTYFAGLRNAGMPEE